MVSEKDVFKCDVCGNVVEVVFAGGGELVCCGKPMRLLPELTHDAGEEKHVPVVEETDSGVLVKVGSVAHPMEEKHFITFIEVITKSGASYRKYLTPSDKPEASFVVSKDEILAVREYCTLHGLWKS